MTGMGTVDEADLVDGVDKRSLIFAPLRPLGPLGPLLHCTHRSAATASVPPFVHSPLGYATPI